MSIKKQKELDARYIPLNELHNLNDAFLKEFEGVKNRLVVIKDAAVITEFHAVLLEAYKGAIGLKARECEVDYAIKCAEIKARAAELKPVRRKRWIFRPYTNRAQDIIEERAELDAEQIHGDAEKTLDEDRERLFPEREKKRAKRREENRKQAEKKLEEIIRKADEETSFDEPAEKKLSIEEIERFLRESASEVEVKDFAERWKVIQDRINSAQNAQKPAENGEEQGAKPLPGQMTFDEVQAKENAETPAKVEPVQAEEQARPTTFATSSRRPRPPRACRKQ